jgi:hypothetical protein
MYPQSNKKGKEKKRKEKKKTNMHKRNHNIIPFVGLKTLQSIILSGIIIIGCSGQSSGK